MTFYDELAADYDELTGHATRARAARAFVEELLGRYAIRSAVDVACGTGLYALALAEAGVETTGVDISAQMLNQAREHADQAGLAIRWIDASMQQLAAKVSDQVDAVLCMGNSLPHLLDDDELPAALSSFRAVLAPDGVLAIHVLNYDRILAQGERIVGITRSGDRQFVRFYDFLAGRVRFNVLSLEWRGQECTHSLHSTVLRPYRLDELRTALQAHGFSDIAARGDLQLGPFDPATSDSLLIIARQ